MTAFKRERHKSQAKRVNHFLFLIHPSIIPSRINLHYSTTQLLRQGLIITQMETNATRGLSMTQRKLHKTATPIRRTAIN